EPVLEILSGPGGILTEPACAVLGGFLGLGTLALPGIPGTIEAQTGLPISSLPIALAPELLGVANMLLFVQGSGCGLLPLAAEHTVCASDDSIAAAMTVRDRLNLPGFPLRVGDFVPEPSPIAGSLVDSFRALDRLGVPGAAEVATALNDVGDCELRRRAANLGPPALQAEPKSPPPAAAPRLTKTEPARLPAIDRLAAAPLPRSEVLASPTADRARPVRNTNALPEWLQLFAVVALVALLYKATSPVSEPSA
ncbi:MAG: hypothetical protein QOI61_2407, partial [Actinomycetota bacterium]